MIFLYYLNHSSQSLELFKASLIEKQLGRVYIGKKSQAILFVDSVIKYSDTPQTAISNTGAIFSPNI